MSVAEAEIAVSSTPTKSDYYSGLLLNARHSRWTLFTALGVPPLAALWAFYNGDTPNARGIGALMLFALTFIGAIAGTAIQAAIVARKAVSAPGGASETIYTFSQSGIAAQSAVASGPSSWAVWNGAFESKKVLTVRSKRGVIIVIPKRGLGEDVLAPLRAILREHIVGPVRLWRGA
jgi:hypothetical protein